ncbi:hypothetical protein J6590_050347 [Homalodisca vitripennis]|nr:hypothetical protein J6590_050347 [Homalodisca vitripennis]
MEARDFKQPWFNWPGARRGRELSRNCQQPIGSQRPGADRGRRSDAGHTAGAEPPHSGATVTMSLSTHLSSVAQCSTDTCYHCFLLNLQTSNVRNPILLVFNN